MSLIIPTGYLEDNKSSMGIRETEIAIKMIKDHFERELADTLNLTRVSAPLFVRPETGLNDNLNGIERPVGFDVKETGVNVEIVQSLAKWKRQALKDYGFGQREGIYTDMNAIRRDETTDNLHSLYVDQWDWEMVISPEDRNPEFLTKIVRDIYSCFCRTQSNILRFYPFLEKKLPDKIEFVSSQELEDAFPDLSPKERENRICREKGAVFISGIGGKLRSGIRHDGRAPDYDDWALNGDILFWYPVLETAMEVSSMGIRVDSKSMAEQLAESGETGRMKQQFHRDVIGNVLPLSVGGGIGQSRICMFYLDKVHIGEVQASVWPDETRKSCREAGITLL
ncbi:aspartate--ammonia ligase [Candidatus Nomurabacteria bacterium]|nr:aspartate--ammonia ligase [Candidatus Nomurabacteria bacterium]